MRRKLVLLTWGIMSLCSSSIYADNNKELQGERIEISADYSFDPSEDCYVKDKRNVFCNGVEIKGAHVDSFEILRDGYSKDKYKMYYRGQRLEGSSNDYYTNPDPLTVLGRGYAKDRKNVYFEGKILGGLDASSFVVLQ